MIPKRPKKPCSSAAKRPSALHGRARFLVGGFMLVSPLALAQPAPPSPPSPPAGPSRPEHPQPAAPAFEARGRVADEAVRQLPPGTPEFVAHALHQSLLAPGFGFTSVPIISPPQQELRRLVPCSRNKIYDEGAIPSVVPNSETDRDPAGCEGSYQSGGDTNTVANAFFEELGTNGRSCVTCHQPPSGMSISVANIQARLKDNQGTDPLFAGVDGANCPNYLPPNIDGTDDFEKAHSLLLERGLIRIFLNVPTNAEFTVTVARDISFDGHLGCNSDPQFNLDTSPAPNQTAQILSFYRRPRISANLNFIMAAGAGGSGPTLMWDGRETSLEIQASHATFDHGHAQSQIPPSLQQISEIVAFEKGFFSAQSFGKRAHELDAAGAKGGPENLSSAPTGQAGPPIFDEFN